MLYEDKAATVHRVFKLKETTPDATLQWYQLLNAEGHYKEGKPFCPMQVKRILNRKAFY